MTRKEGSGFERPLKAHDHWHVGVSYLNISGTFYYMYFVLDGYSRSIVYLDVRKSIKERGIQCILEAGTERYPEVKPRIINNCDLLFIAKEFKSTIKIKGMDEARYLIKHYVHHYRIQRLHAALGNITPHDQLNGKADVI